MANQYPVEWNGRTYYLHDVTVGDKKAFCLWATRWNGLKQVEIWADMPAVLNPILASLPALTWWGDGQSMSKLASEAMGHPDGDRQLNRLLFGDSAKALSDGDLQRLLDDKYAEQNAANRTLDAAGFKASDDNPYPPANDYFLAMKLIREESDPKAKTPGTGPGPAATTAS